MDNSQKQEYIRKHFSKECVIFLPDVRKTKYFKYLQEKKDKISEGTSGRKKHSCYICFQKFSTKDELEAHKFIHYGEKDNDTFSDDNEGNEDISSTIETRSLKKAVESMTVCKESATSSETQDTETAPKVDDSKDPSMDTKYKCLTCNVAFGNQNDIKVHDHTQYFCKYFCKPCDRQFNTKGGFIVHVLQHDMTNSSKFSYRCNKCPYSFDDCYKLKRHYATVHNESNNTAKYAESIVNIRDNPQQTSVEKHVEIILENTQPSPSITASQKPILTPLEQFKVESANPITGSIPIFDCDVCYDVFASERSLSRHKALHKELENKSDKKSTSLILIEDDEIIQQDDVTDKHDIVSHFTTREKPALPNFIATPMAKLTSMVPVSKPSSGELTPNRPIVDLSKRCAIKIGDNSPKTFVLNSDSSVDKTKITSEITQMLAGNKPWPKMEIPRLVPVAQPKPSRLPPRSVLNKQKKQTKIPQPQTISKSPAPPPKQSEISLPAGSPKTVSEAGKPQYMYVLYPQSSGQTAGVPSSAPSLMMVDSSSTMSSPNTSFVFKNQGETNTSTIIPPSGQNQFIINQQINTGGVVINPQPSTMPGNSSFVINPNIEGQTMGIQKNPTLQPFGGVPGAEGGQMFYILMPPSQANQVEATKQNVDLPLPNLQVLSNQAIEPKIASVMNQDVRKDLGAAGKQKKKEPSKRKLMPVKKSDVSKNSVKVKDVGKEVKRNMTSSFTNTKHPCITVDDSNSCEPIVMPIITGVLPGDSPEKEVSRNSAAESQEDDCNIVMPIITSIGTVVEDSKNKKEKIRKDPVSKYESEFAKFLEKSDGGTGELIKIGKPVKALKEPLRLVGAHEFAPVATVVSNDVILLDDNSSSTESEPKESSQAKPKIFVKKLSDLLDAPQTSGRDDPQTNVKNDNISFKHCCLRCNSQFKYWSALVGHLKKQHMIHACKYDGCSIFYSAGNLIEHMQKTHRCSYCSYDFEDLLGHQKQFHANQISNVQIESPLGFPGNITQDISQQDFSEHYTVAELGTDAT